MGHGSTTSTIFVLAVVALCSKPLERNCVARFLRYIDADLPFKASPVKDAMRSVDLGIPEGFTNSFKIQRKVENALNCKESQAWL